MGDTTALDPQAEVQIRQAEELAKKQSAQPAEQAGPVKSDSAK
jgi:hypothetical protein